MASINQSPEVKSILQQTHDLTTALSNNSLGVAGMLLSKELICREVYSKMLIDSYTPTKKAAILVEAVGNTVEIAPVKFQVFLEILSEQICAKEVVKKLHSTYQSQLDQVDDRGSHESVDIAIKIEKLENQFDDLQTRIINELTTKPGITANVLLNKLTRLPLSLRKEYESSIIQRIHGMRTETQINDLFIVHLNPLTSFIDYGLIEYVIKKFGSDALKRDMRFYCSEIKIFMKETTIKQLIDHLPGQAEVPPKFSLIEAKIGENASECTLEQLDTIRKRYCSELRLSEIIFHLLALVESNSFIVRWLVPSACDDIIMQSSVRDLDQSFYREYKIASLTLDGMWLHLSEAEIDAMWSQVHVSDTQFKDQFHTMCKQIVYEMKVQYMTKDHSLSYFQSLNYQQQISDQLSLAALKEEFPVSIVDFRVLKAVIEEFGSNCLKRVMESYCNYMSIFTKQSTAQELINVGNIIQSTGFKRAQCKIMEEASNYKLETLLSFQTTFCTTANFSEVHFMMGEVNAETKGSFTVSWYVRPDIMKFIINLDQSFYQGYKVISFTLDGMWLYMSESEIDVMWSQVHVSDIKFKDQFCTMCKQIVCEMKVQNVSEYRLSSYLQSLNYQQQVSNQLSQSFFEEEFPASFVDFGVLKAVIERFGSDCLKRVMKSYCNYMAVFIKESTAQQLINIGNISTIQSTDFKHFKIAQCKIMEEPSDCILETLLDFRTRFCAAANISEVCFITCEVDTKIKGLFTVSWLVSPSFISDMMKSSKDVDHSLYHRYKITRLTLDGMWLFLNVSEIDVMWLKMCVDDTEFNDQFHVMHKQILCEVDGIGRLIATDKLSSYLMDQQSTLQRDTSVNISEAILNPNFPISVIDFRMPAIVIKLFGSDCLKRVMESYCHFMSTFVEQSTLEPLIDLSPIQLRVPESCLIAECKIKGEPFEYGLEKLLEFQTRFCSMVNIDTVCFVMGKVCKEVSGSFTVSWYIPSAAVSFMKFTRNIFESFYQEYQIVSLTLDGMWIQLSGAEIDTMWSRLHVSDTNFEVQFHAMYKQIVCELEMAQLAGHELSSHIRRSLKCNQITSDWLSHELLNHKLPVSNKLISTPIYCN